MKKFVTILLFLWFLIPSVSVSATNTNQGNIKSATIQNKDSIRKAQKDLNSKKTNEIATGISAEEKRKKEIEAKEHSINKNKKVRRFGVDENLSNTIQKRNIP